MALLAAVAWLLGVVPNASAAQQDPSNGAPAAHAAPASGGGAAQQPAEAAHTPQSGDGAHAAQPGEGGHTAQPGEGGHAEAGHASQPGEGGKHEAESPWTLIGRLFNFALLAGGLVYLLRSRFADYLRGRGQSIRSDLANARQMREEAAGQMATIEERLKSLPGEIEALKQRGAFEISAEQERIREATEAERQRMLAQASREVNSQVRNAERMLLNRAGELAVTVATERVRRTITDADQSRLVDRYLSEVGA